ncbi:MAG: translation elongation factor Ts [Bdellovibrionales bacterium]|nr:translation elongation factor Ts [Bdellovibrionales bacterium]
MSVSAQEVKKLRQETGAGFMLCKEALFASNNDMDKAKEWLKKKGLSTVAKKSSRQAGEGLISSYVHGGGRIGVLLEVNSETDFVARNKYFKQFVKQLNLHIVAMNPIYIKESEIPVKVVEKEKEICKSQALVKTQKKEIAEKIATGLYKKWLEQVCLFHQEFVRDSEEKKQKVEEALIDLIARLGENIVIRRFSRFALGETNEEKKN